MNSHDIELPPLPKRPEFVGPYTAKDMQAYARAAIEADRKRRREPTAAEISDVVREITGCPDIKSGEKSLVVALGMLFHTYAAPQPAEPVKRKRPYAQGTALGEFGVIPMCDQVDDEPVKVPRDDLAHEIWAAAQTAPGEGIEDAVERIAALLARYDRGASMTTALEQANDHAHICEKLAEQYKSDPVLFAALTDAAAVIRDLLRELRRETERRWEGNRRAAQEYVEDMRCLLKEAAQICKDLDEEALEKENRLACGAECAAAIADLAARMNVPFESA